MALFEQLKAKWHTRIDGIIDHRGEEISRRLQTDIEAGKPGPFYYDGGLPPIGCRDERYVHRLAESVEQGLGKAGLADTVVHNLAGTYGASAEDEIMRLDQWPERCKPIPTLMFVRVS